MPFQLRFILACAATALAFLPLARSADAEKTPNIFARDNLIAWCIVPFDAKKRGPEEGCAAMSKLG
jgi:hypothetical protein